MRSARYTGQFKRDVKLAKKHDKDLSKLRGVLARIRKKQAARKRKRAERKHEIKRELE